MKKKQEKNRYNHTIVALTSYIYNSLPVLIEHGKTMRVISMHLCHNVAKRVVLHHIFSKVVCSWKIH